MNKLKKVLSTIIVGTMLCGLTITANAADHTTHAYSYQSTVCYDSYNGIQHQYVTSTTTLPSGQVIYEYGTCQTVVYQYKDLYKCGCGAIKYQNYINKSWHANCGQGWG